MQSATDFRHNARSIAIGQRCAATPRDNLRSFVDCPPTTSIVNRLSTHITSVQKLNKRVDSSHATLKLRLYGVESVKGGTR